MHGSPFSDASPCRTDARPFPGRIFRSRLLALPAVLTALFFFSSSLRSEGVGEGDDGRLLLRSWMAAQGAPNNIVNRVEQDADGYLWLGTMSGLCRFDGVEFKRYPHPAAVKSEAKNVRDFVTRPDGTLVLLPASGGISVCDGRTIVEHPASAQFSDGAYQNLHVEKNGVVWAAQDKVVRRWENGSVDTYPMESGHGELHRRVTWATDPEGKTWVGGPGLLGVHTEGRLRALSLPGEASYAVADSSYEGPWIVGKKTYRVVEGQVQGVCDTPLFEPSQGILALREDHLGRLWMALSGGLIYRLENAAWVYLGDVKYDVNHLAEDKEGNLWLASSGGGLIRAREKLFNALPGAALSLFDDRQGGLWVARGHGGIELLREDSSSRFRPRCDDDTFVVVATLAGAADGSLWLGGMNGLYRCPPGNPEKADLLLPDCRPWAMLRAREGYVWALGRDVVANTKGGRPKALETPPGFQGSFSCIVEDEPNHFWLGTDQGGLFEANSDKIAPAPKVSGRRLGSIHCLWAENRDQLWLGLSNGLGLLEGGRLVYFGRKDGLPEGVVHGILPDASGYLWLVQPNGLCRVAKDELLSLARGRSTVLDVITYGPDEGLVGFSPRIGSQPAYARDKTGALWLCTHKDLLKVRPDDILPPQSPVPLRLDSLMADGRPLEERKPIVVPAGTKRLEVRFSVLSFTAPERVLLRYKLENRDDDWTPGTTDRAVVYADLGPGTYRLRVFASNSAGYWNKTPFEVELLVRPLWWQRTSIRLLGAFAVLALLAWLIARRLQRKLERRVQELEREKALEAERARIARDLHDELGGSITGINLLVMRLLDPQPRNVSGLSAQLAERVRRLALELDRVVWSVSPKNSTLDRLALFIERYAVNLLEAAAIQCRVQGAAGIPPIPFPPQSQHHILAAVKEAVANAAKHSKASEVRVGISLKAGMFEVLVQDNGTGFDTESASHSERNGLNNMKARMQELGGTLSIRSGAGAGTEIRLSLPLAQTQG